MIKASDQLKKCWKRTKGKIVRYLLRQIKTCQHQRRFTKKFLFVSLLDHRRQNFSLQYQYIIKQTSEENKEKYQLGDNQLIQSQILPTNITRIVWETVRRITNEILGVKGLRGNEETVEQSGMVTSISFNQSSDRWTETAHVFLDTTW